MRAVATEGDLVVTAGLAHQDVRQPDPAVEKPLALRGIEESIAQANLVEHGPESVTGTRDRPSCWEFGFARIYDALRRGPPRLR